MLKNKRGLSSKQADPFTNYFYSIDLSVLLTLAVKEQQPLWRFVRVKRLKTVPFVSGFLKLNLIQDKRNKIKENRWPRGKVFSVTFLFTDTRIGFQCFFNSFFVSFYTILSVVPTFVTSFDDNRYEWKEQACLHIRSEVFIHFI